MVIRWRFTVCHRSDGATFAMWRIRSDFFNRKPSFKNNSLPLFASKTCLTEKNVALFVWPNFSFCRSCQFLLSLSKDVQLAKDEWFACSRVKTHVSMRTPPLAIRRLLTQLSRGQSHQVRLFSATRTTQKKALHSFSFLRVAPIIFHLCTQITSQHFLSF